MTKKDYVLIAEVLKRMAEDKAYCFDNYEDVKKIAGRFCNVLKKENPKFDENRFIQACLPTV